MEMIDRFRGCLVGGAFGDALGGPVEFDSLRTIRQRHPAGVRLTTFGAGTFTDDTQMTLFTAEGLIRAGVRKRQDGDTNVVETVHRAYLRWLHTQGTPWTSVASGLPGQPEQPDGWLIEQRLLHRQEAPGNTCLSALRSGDVGTRTHALNNSKGCGGVMRAAPAGLLAADAAAAFRLGCDVAAITHSHPSGYLSAGALAAMVSRLVAGDGMAEAVAAGRALLDGEPDGKETAAARDAAIALGGRGLPEPEQLEALGGGWVGEEALAIAVACALGDTDVATALSASVLHSGDSDSTGAICGNLLGAQLGIDALPADELALLQGYDIVDAVARDLARERFDPPTGDEAVRWRERYPGW